MSYSKVPTIENCFYFTNTRGMSIQWVTPSGVSMSWNSRAYFNEVDAKYLSKGKASHLTMCEV